MSLAVLRRVVPPTRACLLQAARRQSSIPEDRDWWMVEGRLISVNATRNVRKKGEGEEQVPFNVRKEYLEKANHLSRINIGKGKDQSLYWFQYFKVYQEARDEWEKLVWDSPRKYKPVTDDMFFDAPAVKKKKKKSDDRDGAKPFSMEEIQAAIRETIRRPVEKNIEYRTASDTKWPF